MNTPYRGDPPMTDPADPAELETERRKASGPAAFDRLVEAVHEQACTGRVQAASNAELGKTVRTAVVVVAGCAIISMVACMAMLLSMHMAMGEMRAMLQTIIDALPRAHA
jgi:hypothetical protein